MSLGELDELCEEIEMELQENQARSKTSAAVWQQRMERREEAWESARGTIFEHVVRGEALPDNNVFPIRTLLKVYYRNALTVETKLLYVAVIVVQQL